MWLRAGDSEKKLQGKVIWIIGRRDSGKTTLCDAIQKQRPQVIICDDFLRCRAGISGKDIRAYNQMIGLGFALAYQGNDCLIPCGAKTRYLRDYIRENIPNSIFVYLKGRGRPCPEYEEPVDEDILVLDSMTTEKEIEIVLERIWKQKPIKD